MSLSPIQLIIISYMILGASIGSQIAVEYRDNSLDRFWYPVAGMTIWPLYLISEYYNGDTE